MVLTYGSAGVHEPLLESLLAEGLAPEGILVVHNPSRPDESDPSLLPGCEYLRMSHNLGYAAAMNRGIEHQLERDGELLLLLTHDARLRAGALPALLAAATGTDYGVLGPALLFSGSDEPFSFGGLTRPNGTMTHRLAPPGGDEVAPCDWVDGGTMLLRAEVARRVGGFDEGFWGYCEEADFCLRATRAGYRIGVVPGAQVDQDPGGPKRRGPWSYLMTRNAIAYAQRAVGWRGAAFVTARAGALAVYSLAQAAVRGLGLRPRPAVEPWSEAVGTARGCLDFYRGRWGPPPSLPGAGDMSNVDPPAGDRGDGG